MGANGSPTQILRDQHRNILRIAAILEEILSRGPLDGTLDFDAVADCIAFIRLYADALHHGKEEDLLFPELEEAGMSRDAGPIAVMLEEHRQGRAFARTMADALDAARKGDDDAERSLVQAAYGYIDLIRAHIGKEDNVLFNMADEMIDDARCRSLCAAYDGVCRRSFDGCTVSELEGILQRLAERYE